MPNRKSNEREVRTLMKQGGASLAITLPIELIRGLGWKEKQKVVVTRVSRGLLVRDFKRR